MNKIVKRELTFNLDSTNEDSIIISFASSTPYTREFENGQTYD